MKNPSRLPTYEARAARHAHPQAERLVPLMVAACAAIHDFGRRSFAGMPGAKPLSGITFGKGKDR